MRCKLPRDLVLQRQRVAAFHLVASGPELASVRFGKLRGDAQELIGGAHASGDEILHAQLLADPAQLVRRIAVTKRRRARDDEEARHTREQRRDVLGQRVGEKADGAIRRQIGEGQHRDRRTVHDRRQLTRRLRCGLGRRGILAQLVDKAEALARNGADQPLLTAAVAESAARRVDAARHCRVGNDPSVPDRIEQIVLADDALAFAHQIVDQVEDLRFDRDQRIRAPKLAAVGIEREILKMERQSGPRRFKPTDNQ